MSLSIYKAVSGGAKVFAIKETGHAGKGLPEHQCLVPDQQLTISVTVHRPLRFCCFSVFPFEKLSKVPFQLYRTKVNT